MLSYCTKDPLLPVSRPAPKIRHLDRQKASEDIPIRGRRTSKPSVMCKVLLIPVERRQRAIASETSPLPAPSSTLGTGIHVSTSEQCPNQEIGKKCQSEPQTLSCPPEHSSYAEVGTLRAPDHRAIVGLRIVFHLFARVEVVAENHRSRGRPSAILFEGC